MAQGPGGLPTRRTRALRRALKISCTRAACAAWASVSVRMVGCSCSPSASAQTWWIAKTGHRLVAVGVSAVRSGMASNAGRSGRTSTPLTTPLCVASGVVPTARGSRRRRLGARCLLSPTRRPSGGPGVGLGERGGAVRQVRGCRHHGVDGLQAPVAPLRARDNPHLVVVAILQHDHGDGAGVTVARWGRHARRPRVACHQAREVVPPATGGSAFPCRQDFLRQDTEFVGPRRRGGSLPALVLRAGLGSVCGAMSVCTQPRCGTHTPPWAG